MRKIVTAAVVVMATVGIVSMVRAAEKKSIKEIMKEAHGGGKESLLAKVTSGKGDKEDAEKLDALYKDLAENEPKKGDKAAWKKKTEAIVKAADAVVKGEKGAGAKLAKATACAGCHKDHK